ncbi:MAG TPA: cytochrome C oxidase subunit IV [Flavobacteriales bacterium]|nr:cytochrome C oxidase subunit IV [Flavobacteriales bacterium]HIA12692.1 cytochrome C oxidase subunit IV [Flavobacteriales bacterium]HIO72886.1 cytochrome C oxidase subunit IV [Flavobacteriales bacterium]
MERDDIIEYSLDISHTDEEGKVLRKRLWKVFWILLAVTIFEVGMGWYFAEHAGFKDILMYTFIFLTIVKAGYIIMIFMHLGDELSSLKKIILVPYCFFIAYLLFIAITEANFIFDIGWVLG